VSDAVRLTALVTGRVQGVGFRYWTREVAGSLGLRGTATNLRDGRVEVIVEGPRAECEQLLARLTSDDAPGFVGDVSATWADAAGEAPGFRVR
jgi:acylphosphatase